MTYEQIKNLKEKEFKRLCGVKPRLFDEMVNILKQELPKPRQRGGQPKLTIEDQLLIALQYWREYRTYFHISKSWGIHESTIAWSASWSLPTPLHGGESLQALPKRNATSDCRRQSSNSSSSRR